MLRLLILGFSLCFYLVIVACGPLTNEVGPLITPDAIGVSPPPSPLPVSPVPQSIRDKVETNTIVFYTTREGDAPFPLLTLPELPILTLPEFSDIYGNQPGIGFHLANFAPDLNVTGSYLLITGIGGDGPGGSHEVGAGVWLANLQTDRVHKLWDKPVAAAWSPDGEQLAYIENDTLYLRPSIENAEPIGIATIEDLLPLFVDWSPNGDWIAVVSRAVGESVAGSYPPFTDTVWLVSPTGNNQRQLGAFPGYPIQHSRRELQWSPNGEALLVGMVSPNYILTLDGQQRPLEAGSRGLAWVPGQSQLLVRKKQGLFIVDHQGQEVLQATVHFVTAWDFSNDGRYLAYSSRQIADEPVDIFVFDLQSEETQLVGSVPAQTVSSLHWTLANDILIVDDGDYRSPIWAIGVESGSGVETLIEKGLLITVISRSSTSLKLTSTTSITIPTPLATATLTSAITSEAIPGNTILYIQGEKLKSLPNYPVLNQSEIDTIYAPALQGESFEMFLIGSGPVPSPNGRYIVLQAPANDPPPLYPPVWLVDLLTGRVQQLGFPSNSPSWIGQVTWSPDSRYLTYVSEETLYILDVTMEDEPKPIFQQDGLLELFARWSPTGRWIAVVSDDNPEDRTNSERQYSYWIISPDDNTVKNLGTFSTGGFGMAPFNVAWSPDGKLLDTPSGVFLTLDGQTILFNDDDIPAPWLFPAHTRSVISNVKDVWRHALSHRGEQIAYSVWKPEQNESNIYLLDRSMQTSTLISAFPDHLINQIRWAVDDEYLIIGTIKGKGKSYGGPIFILETEPESVPQTLIEGDDLYLIDVFPIP